MKDKFLIITGGTGGHVIPAINFANYLISKNNNCKIIIDKRGYNYINNFRGKINIVHSSNLSGSFFSKILGIIILFFGFLKSFLLILTYKPNIVISFGSYASFFPMLCCVFLKPIFKIKIYVHEQNCIIGRTNKFFLKFVNKLFLNFQVKSKINNKLQSKTFMVGSPEKNTIDSKLKIEKNFDKIFTIFIFGGSQGSEYVTNFSLNLIKILHEEKIINARYIIQCPKNMISKLSDDLKNIQSEIIIKDYYKNIDEVLKNTSIAISRAGAGSINDLINFKIPSILLPLPTAKDNHQFYNASIMSYHDVAIIVDEKTKELIRAKNYIYEIYKNPEKINSINERFDKIKVKNSNSLIYKLITNGK